jgi:hypothetical protein
MASLLLIKSFSTKSYLTLMAGDFNNKNTLLALKKLEGKHETTMNYV